MYLHGPTSLANDHQQSVSNKPAIAKRARIRRITPALLANVAVVVRVFSLIIPDSKGRAHTGHRSDSWPSSALAGPNSNNTKRTASRRTVNSEVQRQRTKTKDLLSGRSMLSTRLCSSRNTAETRLSGIYSEAGRGPCS